MSESAPARQRSPWFYVLLGCGGLALALIVACLASGAFMFNSGKNMVAGVSDPETMKKNALDQLGVIPEGYRVLASVVLPFGVGQSTMLTDQPATDGDAGEGVALGSTGHTFMLKTQLMDKRQLAAAVDYFSGKTTDSAALQAIGIGIDEKAVLKRSELAFNGKKAHLVVVRGDLGQQEPLDGLHAVLLFDCPDDRFHFASWMQKDPAPDKKNDELDLSGTVADEAQLAKFLKSVRVCGK
jgi:hypothetical protein